ncbi:putative transcription factor bHLH041 [Primulina huaijiensis]|uniref:putative transcription factor bHLH041 n=1 Tax=Primulina huaijiensis TaxID=1492673 RepID=UPI003CC79BA4
MDFVFLLDEGRRAAFLRHVIQSFGCSYICLWSQLAQPANCLYCLDGIYQETSSQRPSSSTGSHARSLFDAYSESINYIDSCRIPGFSFKNNLPYTEFKIEELQRMTASEVQLQFYREARIKTAVFMGCASGEIEIGMLHQPTADLEMEMKNLFPMHFSRELVTHPQPADPIQPSSSSSSLRSLSFDSPEYSPQVFSIPSTSAVQAEPAKLKQAVIQESSFPFVGNAPKPVNLAPNTSYDPHQLTIQALRQIRYTKFPTIESEDDAIQKAILAVLSSPSSTNSSSTSQQNPLNLPSISPVKNRPTAFQRYTNSLAPSASMNHKQNTLRRAVVFFRNLSMRRRQENQTQENRPPATRLHHMISERKRREKLNEVFQVLRSLVPAGSKKDKTSILSSTTQYLGSLISQVSELSKRNQELEASLLSQGEAMAWRFSSSQDQRLNVEINQVSEQTSEARILDLRVTVRGECNMVDLVIRILEFIKQQNNIGLLSLESNTRPVESTSVHCVVLRLKIEGDESDLSGLKERVTRALDDVAR